MQPQKSIRVVSAILCALACALIFASCNPKPGGTAAGGGKHKLAFVTNNPSDFWTIARKGTEKAAKDIPGIEVEFRITPITRLPSNNASLTIFSQKASTALP